MSEKKTKEKSTEQKPNPNIAKQKERERLDPVRYGDWEKNGRCIDF